MTYLDRLADAQRARRIATGGERTSKQRALRRLTTRQLKIEIAAMRRRKR